MTKRTHQTLRVGLRRIIRDPQASIRARLQASRLLMQVEGLMSSSKEEPEDRRISEANTAGFRELFAWEEEEKSEEGLPGG